MVWFRGFFGSGLLSSPSGNLPAFKDWYFEPKFITLNWKGKTHRKTIHLHFLSSKVVNFIQGTNVTYPTDLGKFGSSHRLKPCQVREVREFPGIMLEPKMSFRHAIPTNSWVFRPFSRKTTYLIDLFPNVLQVLKTPDLREKSSSRHPTTQTFQALDQLFPDVTKLSECPKKGCFRWIPWISKTLCGASLPDRQPCQWALLDNFSNYLGWRSRFDTAVGDPAGLRVGDSKEFQDQISCIKP